MFYIVLLAFTVVDESINRPLLDKQIERLEIDAPYKIQFFLYKIHVLRKNFLPIRKISFFFFSSLILYLLLLWQFSNFALR